MLLVSGELQHREGGASTDGKSPVRSVYIKKSRNRPDEILSGFDSPLGFESTPRTHRDHDPNPVAPSRQRRVVRHPCPRPRNPPSHRQIPNRYRAAARGHPDRLRP